MEIKCGYWSSIYIHFFYWVTEDGFEHLVDSTHWMAAVRSNITFDRLCRVVDGVRNYMLIHSKFSYNASFPLFSYFIPIFRTITMMTMIICLQMAVVIHWWHIFRIRLKSDTSSNTWFLPSGRFVLSKSLDQTPCLPPYSHFHFVQIIGMFY
jgi:hypothetical protein